VLKSLRQSLNIPKEEVVPVATKTAKAAKIAPLGDRVVIKQLPQEETRASGLVIPDTAQEKPQLGEVIAVGPGRLDDNGKRVAMEVKVGDRVLYGKYTGQEVPRGILGAEEEEYLVLKESDIVAKVV
jgi:chaperonin GroES